MAKGVVEGFTPELRERCRNRCADVGDSPCWQLPEITSDVDGQVIRPCTECLESTEVARCNFTQDMFEGDVDASGSD